MLTQHLDFDACDFRRHRTVSAHAVLRAEAASPTPLAKGNTSFLRIAVHRVWLKQRAERRGQKR
jgi:hypothetical protein